MTKLFILTGILIIPLYLEAQELQESDLDKLHYLPGKVETFYSTGCENKAIFLQEITLDAVAFFENKLQDTFDIKLLVLNRRDWRSLVGGPYLISGFSRNPDRIEIGDYNLYKIKLRKNETLYGKDKAFLFDLIVVHELGHYISHKKKIKSIRWTSEFFADYLLIGFVLEKIPYWNLPSYGGVFFKYLPFKHKSLKEFEENYSRLGPLNMMIYHYKLQELAFKIFKKRGWDFMYEYIDRYTQDLLPPPEKNHLVDLTVSDFQKMEPEIVNEWIAGMQKTYHPLVVLLLLLAGAVTIRLLDNSYTVFSQGQYITKRSHKLFGIPALQIRSNVKFFENQKVARRLKLIMALRPLMYLFFILFILLLLLHH